MLRTLLLLALLSLPVSAQAQRFSGNPHISAPTSSPQFGVYNPRTRQYTLYYQISGSTYVPRQHHYAGYGRYPTTIIPRTYAPVTVPQQRPYYRR